MVWHPYLRYLGRNRRSSGGGGSALQRRQREQAERNRRQAEEDERIAANRRRRERENRASTSIDGRSGSGTRLGTGGSLARRTRDRDRRTTPTPDRRTPDTRAPATATTPDRRSRDRDRDRRTPPPPPPPQPRVIHRTDDPRSPNYVPLEDILRRPLEGGASPHVIRRVRDIYEHNQRSRALFLQRERLRIQRERDSYQAFLTYNSPQARRARARAEARLLAARQAALRRPSRRGTGRRRRPGEFFVAERAFMQSLIASRNLRLTFRPRDLPRARFMRAHPMGTAYRQGSFDLQVLARQTMPSIILTAPRDTGALQRSIGWTFGAQGLDRGTVSFINPIWRGRWGGNIVFSVWAGVRYAPDVRQNGRLWQDRFREQMENVSTVLTNSFGNTFQQSVLGEARRGLIRLNRAALRASG